MGFLTPNASGELEVIKTFALQQLAQIRTTVVGLNDEQAHATPTASALNLTGLLLHAGEVGVQWSARAASAPRPLKLPEDLPEDLQRVEYLFERLLKDSRSLSDTLAFFDRCVQVTEANLDAVSDLSAAVPVPPAPWIPKEITHWEARWCLMHLCTEIARHAGHADIIRETLDGKGSFELNDLADAGTA